MKNVYKGYSDIVSKTIRSVEEIVCKTFGMKRESIYIKNRYRENVMARQAVFLVLHDKCNLSYKQIGRFFNMDHSTVFHGVKKARSLGYIKIMNSKRLSKLWISPHFSVDKCQKTVDKVGDKL